MIPKTIYYTWVSPHPLPEQFNKYIEGWKKKMPDYEIRQISLDSIVKTPFVEECIKREKYAIAGHYGRCDALYQTGGIYFDIDIEAVKSFDDLLENDIFLGLEDDSIVNNAVIGCVKGHPFMKKCIDFMDAFDLDSDNPELNTGPWMFTKLSYDEGILILPPRYFYPYSYKEDFYPECITSDTFTVHHWAATWKK